MVLLTEDIYAIFQLSAFYRQGIGKG